MDFSARPWSCPLSREWTNLSGRYEVRNRTGINHTRTLNCKGNCGADHGPNLDATENAGTAFVGIDVDMRGIADDGIHCDGGLGANCYASCHKTHGMNSRIEHSHLRHQIKPSKQQQLCLEKHCETRGIGENRGHSTLIFRRPTDAGAVVAWDARRDKTRSFAGSKPRCVCWMPSNTEYRHFDLVPSDSRRLFPAKSESYVAPTSIRWIQASVPWPHGLGSSPRRLNKPAAFLHPKCGQRGSVLGKISQPACLLGLRAYQCFGRANASTKKRRLAVCESSRACLDRCESSSVRTR